MTRTTGLIMLVMLALACHSALAASANDERTAPATVAAVPESTVTESPGEIRRPRALPALYISFGAIQAWDIQTTRTALARGGRELNPLMTHVSGSTARMIAVKAASTASTIYFAEKLWRKNRVAAVAVVAAINGATAAISLHNARVARNSR
jgi:hypothetical protein